MATFGIITLGCKVNQYESEAIAELLEKEGLTKLNATSVCDLYIINTCTVTSESDRKARQMIRRAITQNPHAYILVTGCLAETNLESIRTICGVDYVCGNADKTKIVNEALKLLRHGEKNTVPVCNVTDIKSAPFESMNIKKFDRTRAYIKIEDGCESNCTYCIIPKARGKIRSKPFDEVIKEAKELTLRGCREIVLTGIETGSYGRDIGSSLTELLEELDRIDGIGRIRLGSLDPSIMKADFVKRISRLNSLAHHFHISMQSGCNTILRAMKRKYNAEMALESINSIRHLMPDTCFTTDIIVGFPGETEENFNDTVKFVKEAKFLTMHVFPYSKRSGTPAAEMRGQLNMSVKKERVSTLCTVGDEIKKEILEKFLSDNDTASVLFEDYKDGFAYGHTSNFIEIKARSQHSLHSEVKNVKLISSSGSYINAQIAD